jgi:hypothetical protein
MKKWSHRTPLWVYLSIGMGIMGATAGIEVLMGRLPMCKCGYMGHG